MQIPDLVKKYDPENQFDILKNSYQQIEYAWNNKIDLGELKNKKFSKIVVSGLGGSAISADLIQNFLKDELKISFNVNRNYSLPAYVEEKSLVIISSYSGNTEETIEVFESSLKTGCSIIAITTGGKIGEIAEKNNIPIVKLQKGFQPRFALGLSFFSLLKVLQELNLIPDQSEIVEEIKNIWKEFGEAFSKENNEAYQLAEQIIGFIPVIYSCADSTSAIGYRFKCQFNENSKLHAFHNVIPEMNHNEIVGWETFVETQLNCKIINILDQSYHHKIKKRFEITSKLAADRKVEIINLESKYENFKVRILYLIYFCDWITYYTAVLRGFDPSEIDFIHHLKKELST